MAAADIVHLSAEGETMLGSELTLCYHQNSSLLDTAWLRGVRPRILSDLTLSRENPSEAECTKTQMCLGPGRSAVAGPPPN